MAGITLDTRDYKNLTPAGKDRVLAELEWMMGSDNLRPVTPDPKDDVSDTYTPPKSAQRNARKVLEWRDKYGDEVKGMTRVGWTRANQLASGDPISIDTVKRMAQFNRHRKNSEVALEHKDTPWKDAGHVAWLGWGGTEGIDWAISVSGRTDSDNLWGYQIPRHSQARRSLDIVLADTVRIDNLDEDLLTMLSQETARELVTVAATELYAHRGQAVDVAVDSVHVDDGALLVMLRLDGDDGPSDTLVTYRDGLWQEDRVDVEELLESLLGWRTDKAKGGKKRTSKPKCTKGRSCGMSCIPQNRKCKSDLSPAADTVAKSVANSKPKRQPKPKATQEPFDPQVNPLNLKSLETSNRASYKPFMTRQEADEYTKNSVYKNDVFYHGSTTEGIRSITTEGVDISRNGTAVFGQGFYTARDFSAASFYANNSTDGDGTGRVIGMKLDIRNPKVFQDRQEWMEYQLSVGLDPYTSSLANAVKASALIRENGFDGIEIVKDGYVVALSADQVAVFEDKQADPPEW